MRQIRRDTTSASGFEADALTAGQPVAAEATVKAASELEYLQHRDSVLQTVSFIAEKYLSGNDSDLSVPATLEALGRAAGAVRVTLVQKVGSAESGDLIQSLGEWTAPGAPLKDDRPFARPRLEDGPIPGIERWDRALARGDMIVGRSAAFPFHERAQMDADGVRSIAIVPICVEGIHWGQISFERFLDEEWRPELLAALRIAAGIIGAAMRSKRDREELETRVKQRTLELAEANRALRDSEMLHRSVVETSPNSILLLDLQARILMANPRCLELFGCGRTKTLNGELARDWMRPTDPGAAHKFYQDLLTTGLVRSTEAEFTRRDGSTFYAEVSAALIRNTSGDLLYTLYVVRDITRQKELEQHLQHAQKMDAVGRLASGIAHDFNNILTVVKGFGELLAKRLESPGFPRYMADEIVGAADRGAALVDQLLSFSRKQMVEPKVLDVNSAIHEMGAMLQALLREDISIETCLAPDTGSILIDSGQFDQLIINLAVNARDAMPAGGALTISTRRVSSAELPPVAGMTHAAYVLLEVRDTGIGMTEEVRSHIFEPFFTTKDVGKGTGLGLSTIYGIVQQTGGQVDVETAPKDGSTFRIYIPCTAPDAVRTVERPKANSENNCRETILVAENERAVRTLMVTTLEERGYTVLEARNGVQALEIVEQFPGNINLLLTDVVMPQMGGLKLWDNLSRRFPAMRVLYTSGHTDESVAEFPAFLRKPFSPGALTGKVHDVLADTGCPVPFVWPGQPAGGGPQFVEDLLKSRPSIL